MSLTCSKAMSGLSLVSFFQCASLTATLIQILRVSIQYSVHLLWISQGTSKRSKFSWNMYWYIWSIQESFHKCRFAPLFARCHFTVPSNQKSQGLSGITTVCLVYRQKKTEFNYFYVPIFGYCLCLDYPGEGWLLLTSQDERHLSEKKFCPNWFN